MSTFRHRVAKVMYRITWPIWYAVFRFFLRYEFKYEDESVLRLKNGPVMLVSNHVAWFDPFMVGTGLPVRLFPIHYLTKESIFKTPFIGQMVWLYGSIKLKKGVGLEKTLQGPIEILKNNGVVGIFPQGRIWKGGRPRKGRVGAAYVAIHSDPLIVPMRIEGIFRMSLSDFILRRKKVVINVGKPFHLPRELMHNPIYLKEAASYIWGEVEKLKDQ